MPYSRRTGARYAAGSQATFGGWEPRLCVFCEKRVAVTGTVALCFYRDDRTGAGVSFHAGCGTLQDALGKGGL